MKHTHVENEHEELIYPHKVRIFFIENEQYWLNVVHGATTMTLDHWLALEHEKGYSLSELSSIDENRIIVVLDKDDDKLDWETISKDDFNEKRSNNGNGESSK